MNRRPSWFLVIIAIVAAMITAASSPSPSDTLHSGTEGAKAALVRIELRAVAEIAHIDHTTGDVDIKRGRSTVPLGSATGVLTSADGIVATTWENLAVDNDAVAVYAANELFSKVMRVQIVGNDGNPAREGRTPHPYWKPHLQHCYHQETHCVLFRVPQFHVRTYTSEPGGVMAELLNSPSKPHDVALLRISGGGSAPTAPLAEPDAAPSADTILLGFTERPTAEVGPTEIPVKIDTAARQISSSEELTAPLNAGLSGGPVIDRATGQVLGLTGPRQPDGPATLVPVQAIHAAMEEAGVEPSPSKFDAVFRRGIDHLSGGNPGGSAESALEESLTYYDSALATSHLDQARAIGSDQAADDPNAAVTDSGTEGTLPAALLPILAGVLLLGGILGAFAWRRRKSATAPADGTPSHDTGRPNAAHVAVTPVIPARPTRAGDERSAQATAPRVPQQKAQRDGIGTTPSNSSHTGTGRTEAGQHQTPSARQSPAPERPPSLAPNANKDANAKLGLGGDETRAAGPLAPRAAAGQSAAFCSQCGRSIRPGARFCSGCGYRVG